MNPTPKSSPPHLAVVIPMFRAQDHIAKVIDGIPASIQTIVVVDDCSPDDSYDRAQAVGDPRVHFVRHQQNQGVGGATMSGYEKAVSLGAEILIKMDADDQMDPEHIPALVSPILRGEADYTKGNRFVHARQLRNMPLRRRIGNLGLSFLTKLASGYWRVFDPTNGYTALHATVFPLLDRDSIDRRYFFETSLLLELSLHRAAVRDVYIPARYGSEVSSLSEMQSLLGFPPRQIKGFVRRVWLQHFLRDFGLLSVFLVSGTALFGFGVMFGAIHWAIALSTDLPTPIGTVMLSVLPIIIGMQFLLQAVVLDVQDEPDTTLHEDLHAATQAKDSILPRPPVRTDLPDDVAARRKTPSAG